ncbi:hypothetical protein ATKI12_0063 [Kitasatospora sp. Ki12]
MTHLTVSFRQSRHRHRQIATRRTRGAVGSGAIPVSLDEHP